MAKTATKMECIGVTDGVRDRRNAHSHNRVEEAIEVLPSVASAPREFGHIWRSMQLILQLLAELAVAAARHNPA